VQVVVLAFDYENMTVPWMIRNKLSNFIHLDKRLGSICTHAFREGNYAVKALERTTNHLVN